MATAVEVKLSEAAIKAYETLLARIEPKEFQNEILKLFNRLGADVAGYIIKNLLSGQLVKRRTGNLARSIVGRGVMTDGVPSIRVGIFRGPALVYAGVVDQGTRPFNSQSPYDTIRPKNARALAIPQNDALTPAGVPRYVSPRDYPGGLTFRPFRTKNPRTIGGLFSNKSLAGQSNGQPVSLAQIKASYILVTAVDMKPAFYLRTGLVQALPKIMGSISDFFIKRLSGE